MLAAYLCLLTFAPADLPAKVTRVAYGVPHITAPSLTDAFEGMGYAVAQDRLWQMENSRRVALGTLAEVLGPEAAASDREILRSGYTYEELDAQFAKLPADIRAAFDAYARGVNAWISEAKAAGTLPAGYAQHGFEPAPWTARDSVAIAVRLYQQFGRGGAGEIRNMALLGYLGSMAKLKGRELDIFDDLAWQNDPRSTTTLSKQDESANPQAIFAPFDRKVTESHQALLPKLSVLELLPGVRLAERTESTRIAELVAAPFKVGSYAIVVDAKRSANGRALLLSGPQMGFRAPSIVHEVGIAVPGQTLVGADVPGVPGVIVGHTDHLAWGLTSGVADTDDVFVAELADADHYRWGSETRPIETVRRTLKIKGRDDETIIQRRTHLGPIVLEPRSAKVVFIRRAGAAQREMESMKALFGLYAAKSVSEADAAGHHATANFNVFVADTKGNIGYRFAGLVPIRAAGIDPRLPTPADPKFDWKGFVSPDQMPSSINPRSGVLINWNNKPVSWWPNGDTPAWGRIFRDSLLRTALDKPKLAMADLEYAIWQVARQDYNYAAFASHLKGIDPDLDAFDGRMLAGDPAAGLYRRFFDEIRVELFAGAVGSFLTPDNFRLALQPSLMLDALEGRTKFDYLAGRKSADIMKAAWVRVATARQDEGYPDNLRFAPPSIGVPEEPAIPYSDRGTVIQIVEMFQRPRGRNVLTPGVAETGPHSRDQAPLARAWTYKPMLIPKP
jgi:penicillin amidase